MIEKIYKKKIIQSSKRVFKKEYSDYSFRRNRLTQNKIYSKINESIFKKPLEKWSVNSKYNSQIIAENNLDCSDKTKQIIQNASMTTITLATENIISILAKLNENNN